MKNYLGFIPLTEADKILQGFEVQAVRDTDNGVEQCPPDQAQFWSVHAQLKQGSVTVHQCVADLNTEDEAKALCKLLLSVMKATPSKDASWVETHHEVVEAITRNIMASNYEYKVLSPVIKMRQESEGHTSIWELAEELTNKFEALHKGREWDGEFYDEIESYMKTELSL